MRNLILVLVWVIAVSGTALAVPVDYTYQGKLTDAAGAPIVSDTATVQFRIWDAVAGGASLSTVDTTVTTDAQGVFTIQIPAGVGIFNGTTRYLELTVRGDLLSPRQPLTTAPNAFRAGGVDNGVIANAQLANNAVNSAKIQDGTITAADLATNSVAAAEIAANAVTDVKIADEAGIAQQRNGNLVQLVTGTMTDLETVSITIPTQGYIVVIADVMVRLQGTTGTAWAQIQIDETAGGGGISGYYSLVGLAASASAGLNFLDCTSQRTYLKNAGTYTFRFEGMVDAGSNAAADIDCFWPVMTAMFFPTAYGTVTTVSTNLGGGEEDAVLSSERILESPTGQPLNGTMYRIDLSKLETNASGEAPSAEER